MLRHVSTQNHAHKMSLKWRTIPVCVRELSLADVLPTGQAFRWNKTESDSPEWTGAIGDK